MPKETLVVANTGQDLELELKPRSQRRRGSALGRLGNCTSLPTLPRQAYHMIWLAAYTF